MHHEADTDTHVRFDRRQHGSKNTFRSQDADVFPWIRTFSPCVKSRASLTTSAMLVYNLWADTFTSRSCVERRFQWNIQEISGGICWRDDTQYSAAALPPRVSIYDTDGGLSLPTQPAAVHLMLQRSRPWMLVAGSEPSGHAKSRDTMTLLCHIQNAQRQHFCYFFSMKARM